MATAAAASVRLLLHRNRLVGFHSAAATRDDKLNEAVLASHRSTGGARFLAIRGAPNPALLLSACLHHPPRRGRHPLHRAAASAADDYYDNEDNDDDDDDEGGEWSGRGQTRPPGSGGARAREAGRLYVGNLPFSMTPSELTDVFGEAGTAVAVEVVYDRVTDRSRGFAFVTMGSAEEAMEAIRMFDGAQVGGRTVKVNFPEVPRGGERDVMGPRIREDRRRGFVDSPHKAYAGNLSWVVTSDVLREAFAGCPGMLGARVIYDRDTGRSRGYGFVSFSSPEDTRSAVEAMDGVELEGRSLRLNLAAERVAAAAATTGSASLEREEAEVDSASSLGY